MADKLFWTQPLTNVDGTVFDESQFAGYEIEVNGAPVVSVPVAWVTSGAYELPIASVTSTVGSYTARIRVVNRDGVASDFSNSATFDVLPKQPSAPINFAAG
jgi:hypothetical protein